MRFLLGIASTCGVVLVASLVAGLTGYELHSFKMFVILPVGGLISGMGCGYGVAYAARVAGRRPSTGDALLGGALALAGFLGIYYVLYASSHVDALGTASF